MEAIQQILAESVSGGVWKFIGYLIILGMIIIAPLSMIVIITSRITRHITIRKHGYPPAHCYGDLKKNEVENYKDLPDFLFKCAPPDKE